MSLRNINFISLAVSSWIILMNIPLISFIAPFFMCVFLSFTKKPYRNFLLVIGFILIYLSPQIWTINNMTTQAIFSAFPEIQILDNSITRINCFFAFCLMLFLSFNLEYYSAILTVKRLKLKQRTGVL
jgi:hypothetical protein